MTQPLEDVRSDTVSKKSSAADTPYDQNNKYLLADNDLHATVQTRKLIHGGDDHDELPESPSPNKIDPEEYNHLIKMTQGSKEDLSVMTADMRANGLLGSTKISNDLQQEIMGQHSDALAMAQQRNEHGDSFNEIIVKVEMRKF